MRKLSRLKLIFWFWTHFDKIAYFLRAIVLEVTKIMCCQTIPILFIFHLILTLIWSHSFSCVDIDSQSKPFLLLLLLILLATVLFLFLSNFCIKLRVLQIDQSYQNYQLQALDLRFFWLKVFTNLRLTISCFGMH